MRPSDRYWTDAARAVARMDVDTWAAWVEELKAGDDTDAARAVLMMRSHGMKMLEDDGPGPAA